MKIKSLVAAALAAAVIPAQAAIVITEVAPWSSGNSSVGGDWFELTNTGPAAVNISGWRMDDGGASFAASVALNGVGSIAAGESVIFIESNAPATVTPLFKNVWFGGNAPSSLQIGTYSGSGVGLGTGGDGVAIFNGGGALQASVSFGASPSGPFPTFDNTAGASGAITALSAVGVNGAFAVVDGGATLIGSPGVAPIPEPGTVALLALGLLGLFGFARRKQG